MVIYVWLLLQDCSALAFLLDKLLPVSDKTIDIECSTMARMLIAALASCNHSPEAQTVLVTEVIIIFVKFHLAVE
jgi:E3 ubiquitin-protein ligase HUWE1